MIVINPFTKQILINANPEGCNQYSGKDCIKDDSGKPLTLYHGTDAKKDFPLKEMKSGYKTSEGIYFSRSPESASKYAGIKPGARVYPVHLKMKKPKRVKYAGNFKKGALSSEGYDGAISEDDDEYVVLSPDQIISAIKKP